MHMYYPRGPDRERNCNWQCNPLTGASAARRQFIDVRLNEIASSLSLQDLIMFSIDEFNLSVVRRAQHIR